MNDKKQHQTNVKLNKRIKLLESKIIKYDELFDKIGNAIDANAKVLMQVTAAMNILCKKAGVSTNEVLQEAVRNLASGIDNRSESDGTGTNNSGQSGNQVPNGPVEGVVIGSETRPDESGSESKNSNNITGDSKNESEGSC